MRDSLIALCCGILLLSSCQEKDLLVDNPPPATDNLFWSFVPFYGDEGLKYDSMYTNKLGIDFIIDSVSILISDVSFYDENLEQTLDTVPNFIYLTRGNNEQLNGSLPAGGYYGKYQVIIGSDSSRTAQFQQSIGSIAPELVREDEYGFDFFNIKGRIWDPSEPQEDSIMIPVEYTIGSYLLTDTMFTDRRSFSIDNHQQVTIVLLGDLKPILDNLNFNLTQEIISDPSDVQDFTNAQMLRDSLSIGIF
jgi:hypothetical protein